MSDPYERVKGGRLSFKGGSLATRKSIDKKKHKKKMKKDNTITDPIDDTTTTTTTTDGDIDGVGVGGEVYTIDAAKKLKYDELFPVETKKFAYDPKSNSKSVEDALDDRVKKKADRYCK